MHHEPRALPVSKPAPGHIVSERGLGGGNVETPTLDGYSRAAWKMSHSLFDQGGICTRDLAAQGAAARAGLQLETSQLFH